MKEARHDLILDLIGSSDIETQEDLAKALRRKGMDVTQATVSRDIKELRLLKVLTEKGTYKYATAENVDTGMTDRFFRIFAEAVVAVSTAGNLIIIKTLSGTANAAAEAVDGFKWPEITGSIAGDNTIFVAIRDIDEVKDIEARFKGMMR